MNLTLPTDSAERKNYPIFNGLVRYFPAALAGVAKHSKIGNDKHNPGQPLHHARSKSTDHEDCIGRHLIDFGDLMARLTRTSGDTPDIRNAILDEVNALAWRALALSQRTHEELAGAPLAPGAKLEIIPDQPDRPERCTYEGFDEDRPKIEVINGHEVDFLGGNEPCGFIDGVYLRGTDFTKKLNLCRMGCRTTDEAVRKIQQEEPK